MGWISNILGTDGVVDGIKEGVDKAILTAEERLDYHKELLKAYEPFKLIQRYLALMVASMFAFVMVVSVLLVVVGIWVPVAAEASAQINSLEAVQYTAYSFMTVMSLYFSGGVINSFRKDK